MMQSNHQGCAQIAVRKEYIGVLYAGADAKYDTKALRHCILNATGVH